MNITPIPLRDAVIVESSALTDHRGAFTRLYCERELDNIIGDRRIVQINHSMTRSVGAVRGFHYQMPPHAEMKLVRCIKGRAWDVVVDLRYGSPTFLRWHATELTAANGRMMVIPEGCAHGFQALEEDSELLYLHTAFYVPGAECGVNVYDPSLAVAWPMPISDLSERDKKHPAINDSFAGILL